MKIIYFFTVCLFVSPVFAFTLNSSTNPNFKGWSNPKIEFAINRTGCPANIDSVIEEAFDIWRNVASSKVELKLVGETTSTGLASPTTIYCEVNFGVTIGGTPADNDSTPGVAQVGPAGANYADQGLLILNISSGQASINTLDPEVVKIVLAHEIGHILGLGHSHDTSALMYFDASAKGTLSLAQDDIDGVSYLYPRNEVGGDDLFGGCGTVHNSKPPTPLVTSVLFALMSLPFLLALILKARRIVAK